MNVPRQYNYLNDAGVCGTGGERSRGAGGRQVLTNQTVYRQIRQESWNLLECYHQKRHQWLGAR